MIDYSILPLQMNLLTNIYAYVTNNRYTQVNGWKNRMIDHRSILDQGAQVNGHDNLDNVSEPGIFFEKSIGFSGGGYNCVYHLGVIKYIFQNPDIFRKFKYLGSSGGACMGGFILAYQSDPDRMDILDKIVSEIIIMEKENIKYHEQVGKYTEIIMKYVDHGRFDKYIKGSGKCYISMTDVTNLIPYNHIESVFTDYESYISHLKGSACIPYVFDKHVRHINNRYYIDGGLTNNIPTINANTIKVSCLNYPFLKADIYPRTISQIRCSFYHPGECYIRQMFELGYSDMCEYMKKHMDVINMVRKERELETIIAEFINDRTTD